MTLAQELDKKLLEVSQAEAVVAKLKAESIRLRSDILANKHGITYGCDYMYQGAKVRLVSFCHSYPTSGWVMISPYKKDGSLSAKNITCFNPSELVAIL